MLSCVQCCRLNNREPLPGSVKINRFVELCNRCGDCADHCPTKLLRKGRGGYPVVDFRTGQCDFCG
ncbi:4Fe-4S binding protein, partial [Kaarinaea lacus]